MLSLMIRFRWQVISMALTLCVGSVCASASIKDQLNAVLSIKPDTEYGGYLAGECLTCHVSAKAGGTNDASIPLIHGTSSENVVQALLEYRAELRDNQIMRSVARRLTDDEIAALAAWFSQQE